MVFIQFECSDGSTITVSLNALLNSAFDNYRLYIPGGVFDIKDTKEEIRTKIINGMSSLQQAQSGQPVVPILRAR